MKFDEKILGYGREILRKCSLLAYRSSPWYPCFDAFLLLTTFGRQRYPTMWKPLFGPRHWEKLTPTSASEENVRICYFSRHVVLCCANSETASYVFLHCDYARRLWSKLFGLYAEDWVSVYCSGFLAVRFAGFGRDKRRRWRGTMQFGDFLVHLAAEKCKFKNCFYCLPELLWDRFTMG